MLRKKQGEQQVREVGHVDKLTTFSLRFPVRVLKGEPIQARKT